MIDGVLVIPLQIIPDERGMIKHMLRCDAPHFDRFGEIYFSVAYPGIIKAWHLHKKMTLNYAVVSGIIKLVLYDEAREKLQELFIDDEPNYVLVSIPPGVWNGYKNIGQSPAIIANCATLPHDPDEMIRLDPFNNHIPYDWTLKHG